MFDRRPAYSRRVSSSSAATAPGGLFFPCFFCRTFHSEPSLVMLSRVAWEARVSNASCLYSSSTPTLLNRRSTHRSPRRCANFSSISFSEMRSSGHVPATCICLSGKGSSAPRGCDAECIASMFMCSNVLRRADASWLSQRRVAIYNDRCGTPRRSAYRTPNVLCPRGTPCLAEVPAHPLHTFFFTRLRAVTLRAQQRRRAQSGFAPLACALAS